MGGSFFLNPLLFGQLGFIGASLGFIPLFLWYFDRDLLIALCLFVLGWPDFPRVVKGLWMSRLGALCFLYHRIGSYIPALGSGIQAFFMNANDQCTTLQLSCFFAPEGFSGNPAAGQLVHIWFCWAWWVAINQAWLHSDHLTAAPSLLQVKGMWSTVWSKELGTYICIRWPKEFWLQRACVWECVLWEWDFSENLNLKKIFFSEISFD